MLAKLIKEKTDKNQMNKIRKENEEITTNDTEMQSIIRDYYEELYDNKTDNMEETGTFLQKYNLPKMNQEEIENLKTPTTSTEIEAVIKNLPTNKSTGPHGFTGEFYQKFREELTQSVKNLPAIQETLV